ncbi:MAG: 50S ribosomal protein L24e [Candidatus Woesearchaeota archaeon]
MKCTFCKNEIARGTGKIYIKKDGKVFYFCSTKCEKNLLKLHRKARETKWTEEAHMIKREGVKTKEPKEDKKQRKAGKKKRAAEESAEETAYAEEQEE